MHFACWWRVTSRIHGSDESSAQHAVTISPGFLGGSRGSPLQCVVNRSQVYRLINMACLCMVCRDKFVCREFSQHYIDIFNCSVTLDSGITFPSFSLVYSLCSPKSPFLVPLSP